MVRTGRLRRINKLRRISTGFGFDSHPRLQQIPNVYAGFRRVQKLLCQNWTSCLRIRVCLRRSQNQGLVAFQGAAAQLL